MAPVAGAPSAHSQGLPSRPSRREGHYPGQVRHRSAAKLTPPSVPSLEEAPGGVKLKPRGLQGQATASSLLAAGIGVMLPCGKGSSLASGLVGKPGSPRGAGAMGAFSRLPRRCYCTWAGPGAGLGGCFTL